MTKRWYLNGKNGANSDCTLATCVYNEKLLAARTDSTTLNSTIVVAATWRDHMVWTTEAGDPGITDWPSGQYHGQANITAYGQGSYRFRMVQVSSTCGWVWGIMVSAGKTGTGIKTWTANKNPASSSSGDRLQVRLQTYLTISQWSPSQALDIEAGDNTWTQGPLGSEGAVDAEAQSSVVDAAAQARPQAAVDAEAQASSVDADATTRPQAAVDAQAQAAVVDAAAQVRRQAAVDAAAQDATAELLAQVRRQAAVAAEAQAAAAELLAQVRRQAAVDAAAQASSVVARAEGGGVPTIVHALTFPVRISRVIPLDCHVDLAALEVPVHRTRRLAQRVARRRVIPAHISRIVPMRSEP